MLKEEIYFTFSKSLKYSSRLMPAERKSYPTVQAQEPDNLPLSFMIHIKGWRCLSREA